MNTETALILPEKDERPRLARPVDEFFNSIGVSPGVGRGKLRKMGLFPDVIEIPNTYVQLITPEAEQQYIERLKEFTRAQSVTLQKQSERRKRRNGLYKGSK
jgi:hypothetical protein